MNIRSRHAFLIAIQVRLLPNYKTSLPQIDFQSLSQNPLPCSWSGSEFLYAPYGHIVTGKIEKVPRGIWGEKSSKDMARSKNLVSTIGALASPKWWTEPGVRKGKRSLLASHIRCICSMGTTHNSVTVKLGIKVMKLMESLIGREVTVGQGSECHLTFVRGLLHIAQQDPRIDHKTSWMTISSVPQGIPVWVAYWKVTWPSE